MSKPNYYLDNTQFLKALTEYKKKCEDAKAQGKEEPPIPNYIGECWIKIAENISNMPKFRKYTFIEEMQGDGIENCLLYFRNFDPEKSMNPFGYFSRVIYWAMVRRIIKEKKQLYLKYKATIQCGVLDEAELYEDADGHFKQFEMYDNISEFVKKYEDAKEEKKKKKNVLLPKADPADEELDELFLLQLPDSLLTNNEL